MKPLGLRGGVPEAAADVDLASHLEAVFLLLAAQVRDPSRFLLLEERRPLKLKHCYTWLHRGHARLVRKNLKAGLHVALWRGQAVHNGKLVQAGACS